MTHRPAQHVDDVDPETHYSPASHGGYHAAADPCTNGVPAWFMAVLALM
jgi:hypothetical protein